MKTLTEVTKKIEVFQDLDAKLKAENPDLKHGIYEITDVPLKVFTLVGELLKINPSYDRWSKRIAIKSYTFQLLGIDLTVYSVLCEPKSIPDVNVDEYVEIKEKEVII